MKVNIQDFLLKKQSYAGRSLTAHPNLIALDGVDGCGKTTLARSLAVELAEAVGDSNVLVCQVTNLAGSPGQVRLARAGSLGGQIDLCYLAGVNRAYGEIVLPALRQGKLVVVDRSELDLLRYAVECSDTVSYWRRHRRIADGTVTHFCWAGWRLLLTARPDDIWENLSTRGDLSSYDPKSLTEVRGRLAAQRIAADELLAIPFKGSLRKAELLIGRQPEDVEIYMRSLAKGLAGHILKNRRGL